MPSLIADPSGLLSAASTFLSRLSAGAQQASREQAEASRQHIAGGAYWTPRTGKTGQSFRVEQDPEGLGAVLRSGRAVARFLDTSTRPHVIVPRRRDALRFIPAGGGIVFTRRVNHPGTKPLRYLDAEATRAEPALLAAVERSTQAAADSSGF